ncbi:MAG: hypothetical protein E3J83_04000 [Candidatus Atribacteria bacterium]|nr:MAG: hypothetical protein E3J83_04000 [Candidatus Atribacteria bacterium]
MWIISEGGIVVFSRVYEEMLDDQLFGALLTALNSFAEQIAQDGLSNFELGNKRFTILKRAHFIFIANSDKKIKPKKALQELRSVMDKFFTVYSKETINNWDNDVSIFSNFDNEIEDSLDDPIKKMEKAFW